MSAETESPQSRRPEELKIVLLCTDDPHQFYLATELERRFGTTGVLLERNSAQIHRLWKRRRYKAWLYRRYHAWRSRISGYSKYNRDFFKDLVADGADWPSTTVEVPWINGRKARETVAAWQPDLTIVCGTGVLRRSLLAHTGPTINIHGGCLPEYKGNHCVFFAFYEQRFDQIGATLHHVIPELDSGPMLAVARPAIYPHDNDGVLYCRSVHLAMQALFGLIERLRSGESLSGAPQPDAGRTFRHRDRKPHLDLWLWLRRKLGRHPVPCRPTARVELLE